MAKHKKQNIEPKTDQVILKETRKKQGVEFRENYNFKKIKG
jgi:hypothetical protein